MQLRDILRGPTALLLASMAALTAACGTTSPSGDPGVMTTPQSPAVGSDSPAGSAAHPTDSTPPPADSTAPPADGALTSTPSSPSYSPGSAGGSEGTATTESAGDDGTRTVPSEAGTGACAGGRALIDEVAWVEIDERASLEVVPSDLLRDCALAAVDDLAWAEVLELQPDADTPGMVEQFTCHVLFAPRKQEWRLEPWRPVVDGREMIATRCNPGGADPDLG